MVGGLLLAQAQTLALFTTPVVYLTLDRAHYGFMRWRGKRAAATPPPTP